ncbi:MAG TPA: diacylglycerol kinase [Candidatus Nitrosotenuis sp.]|jgi:diacylglycerol kinase (ATP)|nr:diacylglycerol kinase [Candidatus Nitrosotenuis sp.]
MLSSRKGGPASKTEAQRAGQPQERLSLSRPSFAESVNFAVEGLLYAVRHERSFKIHFAAGVAALVAALALNLSTDHLLWVLGAVILVWMMEMMNTSVEAVVNLLTTSHHPLAKVAKDAAAGAVLLASLFSLAVAYLVLWPALMGALLARESGSVAQRAAQHPVHTVLLVVVLILVVVVVGKAIGHRGSYTRGGVVSGHAALAFGAATAIVLLTREPLVAFLAFLVSALVAHSRVDAGIHRWIEVIFGALIGVALCLATFYLFRVLLPAGS